MSCDETPVDSAQLSRLTYEELVELLERLTGRIASGEVGIEEAAGLYETAVAVHKEATERLERVRERIESVGREAGET